LPQGAATDVTNATVTADTSSLVTLSVLNT
jgi:hypothetical protein